MELFFPPTCPFFTIEDYKHAMTWLYLNRVDLGAEPVPIVNTLNLDYSSCSPATQTATQVYMDVINEGRAVGSNDSKGSIEGDGVG